MKSFKDIVKKIKANDSFEDVFKKIKANDCDENELAEYFQKNSRVKSVKQANDPKLASQELNLFEKTLYIILKNLPGGMNFSFYRDRHFTDKKNIVTICAALKFNAGVYHIIFEDYKFELEEIQAISEMLKINKGITHLDLSYSKLTGNQINLLSEALKVNSTLKRLTLKSVNCDDEGAKAIAEMLKFNRGITELHLEYNKITDEGIKYLAEAITYDNALIKIDLYGNTISEEATISINDAFKKKLIDKINSNTCSNKDIEIYWEYCFASLEDGVQTLSALCHNTSVTKLNFALSFGSAYKFTRIFSELIRANKNITHLSLGNTISLETKHIAELDNALIENNTITSLNLQSMRLGDEGADVVARMLKCNRNLTKLNISHNNITHLGLQKIVNSLKGYGIKILILRNIRNFPKEKMELPETQFEILEITKCIVEIIQENNSITHLDLSDNDFFSVACVKLISEALKAKNQLISFGFSGNNINDEGCKFISEAIRSHQNLAKFYIDSCDFGIYGLKHLREGLSNHKRLRCLSIKGTAVVVCSKTFLELLEMHPNLVKLQYYKKLIFKFQFEFHDKVNEILKRNKKAYRKAFKQEVIRELNGAIILTPVRQIVYSYLGYKNTGEKDKYRAAQKSKNLLQSSLLQSEKPAGFSLSESFKQTITNISQKLSNIERSLRS